MRIKRWGLAAAFAAGAGYYSFARELPAHSDVVGGRAVATGEETTATEAATDAAESEEVMPVESETPTSTPLNPKWAAPDFTGQEKALGWTPSAFDVPKGMEERVQFWKDIYSKYTSEQGVIHDSKYVHLVYDTVDFSDISASKDLGPRAQQKARKKRVDDKKKEIVARLSRLAKL
ncbi:MAG: hypothetical protein HC902_02790 [Calothrix sp. SM1_5_4]|nr:hypothetical protein [Calothrix sp. SM1_5_4]